MNNFLTILDSERSEETIDFTMRFLFLCNNVSSYFNVEYLFEHFYAL